MGIEDDENDLSYRAELSNVSLEKRRKDVNEKGMGSLLLIYQGYNMVILLYGDIIWINYGIT